MIGKKTEREKVEYKLKIIKSLIRDLPKLKVMSIPLFFDYFTDLLLIDLD
jgi:hypothetical protein